MGRRSGFSGLIVAIAKDAARAQRQAEANQRRLIREQERTKRQLERYRVLQQKEARQRYIEERVEEVNEQNATINDTLRELKTIIEHTLSVNDTISFDFSPRLPTIP